MIISLLVAMDEQRGIGLHNRLPWHLSADQKRFKELTMGHHILMGRKTYESIGKPLPNRYNIVITRDTSFQAPGCLVVNSIDTALASVHEQDEIFVIGGALLFQEMLPRVQRLYLTIIHHSFLGDTYFPEIDENQWLQLEKIDHAADERNPYSYSFITLDRKS